MKAVEFVEKVLEPISVKLAQEMDGHDFDEQAILKEFIDKLTERLHKSHFINFDGL